MYAKIINEETKACEVGIGTNTDFYKSIGMSEMDVEQAYNGSWYLKGYAPEKPQSVIDNERIAELQKYLDETDWYAVRFAETGAEIPDAVKAERQAAREEISRLRSGVDNG
jgi:hypothetical protein